MPCSAAVYEREVSEEGEERRREEDETTARSWPSPQEPRGAEAGQGLSTSRAETLSITP